VASIAPGLYRIRESARPWVIVTAFKKPSGEVLSTPTGEARIVAVDRSVVMRQTKNLCELEGRLQAGWLTGRPLIKAGRCSALVSNRSQI